MRWFWRLTGGRPMIRTTAVPFKDAVSGKLVYFWVDRLGLGHWMAYSRWSRFRVLVFDHKTYKL